MSWAKRSILWPTVISLLGIACFPANPLVLTGLVETRFYPALFAVGWVVWAIGMALVLSPMIMFPRRGGVPKGKSFPDTTRLVDTGVYSVVRHPQYLGGILSIFVTTLLWYPHWLFGVLGALGTVAVYMGCIEEDRRLVQKFGDEYVSYIKRVPRVNILAGILRLTRHKQRS